MKACSKNCGYFGGLEGFYKCKANPDGHMNICKKCHKGYMAMKRAENAKPPKPLLIPEEKHPLLIHLYQNTGMSVEEIGKRFGGSREVVRSVLRKLGIPKREPITPKREKPPSEPDGAFSRVMASKYLQISLR